MPSWGLTVLILTVLPAKAHFYTYLQWDRLPPNSRGAYIAGAFDVLTIPFDAVSTFPEHYGNCIGKTEMTNMQLAENVRSFASARPEYQRNTVLNALVNYLIELCGRAPQS